MSVNVGWLMILIFSYTTGSSAGMFGTSAGGAEASPAVSVMVRHSVAFVFRKVHKTVYASKIHMPA